VNDADAAETVGWLATPAGYRRTNLESVVRSADLSLTNVAWANQASQFDSKRTVGPVQVATVTGSPGILHLEVTVFHQGIFFIDGITWFPHRRY